MEFFLDASAPPLGLRVTLNPLCAEPTSNLFVQGLFGVRQALNKECIYLQSSTQSFADSDTVFIELNLVLNSEQYEYCARATLNGRENTIVDGKYMHLWLFNQVETIIFPSHAYFVMSCIVCQSNNGEDTCKSEGEVLSAGGAAGIAVTVTLLLALPVGVVIGLGVAWYVMRRGRDPTSEGHQQKMEQVQEAIYEEPPETTIPLSDNQAYGHFDIQRKNE